MALVVYLAAILVLCLMALVVYLTTALVVTVCNGLDGVRDNDSGNVPNGAGGKMCYGGKRPARADDVVRVQHSVKANGQTAPRGQNVP